MRKGQIGDSVENAVIGEIFYVKRTRKFTCSALNILLYLKIAYRPPYSSEKSDSGVITPLRRVAEQLGSVSILLR